jgi:hypothetical protein
MVDLAKQLRGAGQASGAMPFVVQLPLALCDDDD